MSKDQVFELMAMNFQDYSNNYLKGIGLYIKATLINFAETKKAFNNFSTDPHAKYLNVSYWEKDLNLDEVRRDIRYLCEMDDLNFFLIVDQCVHSFQFGKFQNNIYFLYYNGVYHILCQDPKFEPVYPLQNIQLQNLLLRMNMGRRIDMIILMMQILWEVTILLIIIIPIIIMIIIIIITTLMMKTLAVYAIINLLKSLLLTLFADIDSAIIA